MFLTWRIEPAGEIRSARRTWCPRPSPLHPCVPPAWNPTQELVPQSRAASKKNPWELIKCQTKQQNKNKTFEIPLLCTAYTNVCVCREKNKQTEITKTTGVCCRYCCWPGQAPLTTASATWHACKYESHVPQKHSHSPTVPPHTYPFPPQHTHRTPMQTTSRHKQVKATPKSPWPKQILLYNTICLFIQLKA